MANKNKNNNKNEPNTRKIISMLFDEGSFVEIGQHISSTVITGYGQIDGAIVYSFLQNAEEKSGAVGKDAALKIKKLYDMAANNGSPVIAFYNSKGGDIAEGAELLAAYSGIAENAAKLSGVVPQISVVTGLCAGITSAICRMADFVIMTVQSELFLSAPFVNDDGKLEGAGTALNAAKSGVADILVNDAAEAVEAAKKLVRLLPQNNLEPAGNDYFEINSAEVTAGIKGSKMVAAIADINSLTELNAEFGTASYTAIGSLNWRTTGFIATNKTDSKLTAQDSAKIAKFLNICDAYSIPVITILDTEGFEPSSAAELSGSIRDAAKLAQIYGSATTPKISLITGNAFGSAFIALGGIKNTDMLLAYESAIISPVSPKTAAIFLSSDKTTDKSVDDITANYVKNEASALNAASKGLIDRIITPAETRSALLSALEVVSSKRASTPNRKHINFIF